MTRKAQTVTQRLDELSRRHPRLMWLGNAILMLIVTLSLLTATEAPVILYQAF
jgi:hypothetical protein